MHASADEIAGAACRGRGARSSRSTPQRCEYRTSDDDLEWLALRIAMLGVDVDVHEPPELVEHLAEIAGRLSRATSGGNAA